MPQNDSFMTDEDRLQGVARHALSAFTRLADELDEDPTKTIPRASVRRVASAVSWIEERLSVIPSHEAQLFVGRGSAAELDALVREALGTLRTIGEALGLEEKAKAYRTAVEAMAELEGRLDRLDQYLRCRAWGIAA